MTCILAAVVALGSAAAPGAIAATWAVQPFAVPIVNADSSFQGVSCASSTTCMAVGVNDGTDKTFAESWNGTTWAITPTPSPSSKYNELLGVSCGSTTACAAVGWDYDAQGDPAALATTWNGAGWGRPASIPTPAGTRSSTLEAVSCPAASSCMAVGTYTDNLGAVYPLAEQWNGSAWTLIATPTAGQQGSQLTAISCSSASACMAIGGTSSQPLVETWDGSSWTIASAPTSVNLTAVSCPAANACIAVGDNASPGYTLPLAAEWNGSSWTAATLPKPSGSYNTSLSGVSCTSTSSCVAVGNYTLGSSSSHEMVGEVFDGSTWTMQTPASPQGSIDALVHGVSCSNAGSCTAAGVYTNAFGAYLPSAEVYTGSSWSAQAATKPTMASPSQRLNGVNCLTATFCTIVGGYANGGGGAALVEAWNGSSWTIQPTPNPGEQNGTTLADIWCGSPSSCIAVGNYWDTHNYPHVFAIELNGARWTPLHVPDPPAATKGFMSVSCASASACAAVGWQVPGGYDIPLAETWNGTTWTIDPVPVPSGLGNADLTGVSCSLPTACTAVGYYKDPSGLLEILTEVWNGVSWSFHSAPTPSGASQPSFSGVSCTLATTCTAVGDYGSSSGGGPLAEFWDGSSWSIQSTPSVGPLGTGLTGVSCAQPASCEAVGTYKTSSFPNYAPVAEAWDGTSWSVQTVPAPPGATSTQLSHVSCGTATTCMATGTYYAPPNNGPLLEHYS